MMKRYFYLFCALLGLSMVAACKDVSDMSDPMALYSDSPTSYRMKWLYASWSSQSDVATAADGIEESSTLSYDLATGLFTITPMPVNTFLAIGGKRGLPVVSAEPYVMNPYRKGYGSTNSILGVTPQSYQFNFLEDQKVRTMQVDFRSTGEISIDRYTNSAFLSLEVIAISIDGTYLEPFTGGVLMLN